MGAIYPSSSPTNGLFVEDEKTLKILAANRVIID